MASKNRKGQSSIEFLAIVGIGMVIATPFIFAANGAVLDIGIASSFLSVDSSLDNLEKEVKNIKGDPYPARTRMNFETPRGVEEVYNIQSGGQSAIVFEIMNRGSLVNRSVVFDFPVVLKNKGEIQEEGVHELMLKSSTKQLNVSVLS